MFEQQIFPVYALFTRCRGMVRMAERRSAWKHGSARLVPQSYPKVHRELVFSQRRYLEVASRFLTVNVLWSQGKSQRYSFSIFVTADRVAGHDAPTYATIRHKVI